MQRANLLLTTVAAALVPACSGAPAAPAMNDPAYQVTARKWLMVGDGLTPKDATLDVKVVPPAGTGTIDAWIDGGHAASLAKAADGSFSASVSAPSEGDHQLVLVAGGAGTGFFAQPLHVSAALYAVVSTDWDDSDNMSQFLMNIETLRSHHPHLVMTQFFGPYVLTDPMTATDRAMNVQWIQTQHSMFGDEIGVHIHPWCNFVTAAGVTCRTMPSTVYPAGDPSGYTVIFASYTQAEQTTLLQAAATMLMMNGLGRPTSFRAGGWTAQLSTIAACQAAGYTVESSAFPADTIQQAWAGYVLASWNAMNWMGITETSQPYYPSTMNLVSASPAPDYPVLEIPDNGCLVDYMTGGQMIEVLDMNWTPGTALAAPRVFQTGLHPPDFDVNYLAAMETNLSEVDMHLYADDNGPILYGRLGDLKKVWPGP